MGRQGIIDEHIFFFNQILLQACHSVNMLPSSSHTCTHVTNVSLILENKKLSFAEQYVYICIYTHTYSTKKEVCTLFQVSRESERLLKLLLNAPLFIDLDLLIARNLLLNQSMGTFYFFPKIHLALKRPKV